MSDQVDPEDKPTSELYTVRIYGKNGSIIAEGIVELRIVALKNRLNSRADMDWLTGELLRLTDELAVANSKLDEAEAELARLRCECDDKATKVDGVCHCQGAKEAS